ncbi:MAG: DUF6464 family protein [Cyanobacteria bacterium P01_F01_bin.150]
MTRKHYRGERLILHNFSYQELACANFQDAILFCCDFRGAHLYRANFINATLVTCDFSGACLNEADFRVRSQRTCSFGNIQCNGIILPPEDVLGNPNCVHNAQSSFLRCAVNPLGPCEECRDFEKVS